MEIFLLQQAIEKIKDDILLQLNLEMKKAIRLIEDASSKYELQIKTFSLDTFKIEAIKSQLGTIFGEYQFKVESDHPTEATSHQIATEVIDRVTQYPLLEETQDRKNNPEDPKIMFRDSVSDVKFLNPVVKEKTDSLKPSFSSLRNLKLKDSKNSITNESVGLPVREAVDSPIKETLFESIFKPQPSSKLETSKKLFEFEAELQLPDVTDTNFNQFLENELERIKKTFLEDTPMPPLTQNTKIDSRKQSEKIVEEIEQTNFSKRASSIGNQKNSSALTQSPRQKRNQAISYKEKFEDLYFKGKNTKVPKEPKKQTTSIKTNTKGFLAPVSDLQDEFKSISQTSKSLSKYSRPQLTGSQPGFSPLFKAD